MTALEAEELTESSKARVEREIDRVQKAVLRAAEEESAGDTSLAVAGLGAATMYLLATMKPNDLMREDFLKGLAERFDLYARAIAEMESVEQLEQSIREGKTRES